MNASLDNLNPELKDTLNEIFSDARRLDPALTDQQLLELLITQWLDRYRMPVVVPPAKKEDVQLGNELRHAIAASGKTQTEIANAIGLDRTYLNQVINKKYEPSLKLGLLLCRALGLPTERIEELFYLIPASE